MLELCWQEESKLCQVRKCIHVHGMTTLPYWLIWGMKYVFQKLRRQGFIFLSFILFILLSLSLISHTFLPELFVHSSPQIPASACWGFPQHDRNWLLFVCRCYSFPSLKKRGTNFSLKVFCFCIDPWFLEVAPPRIIRNLCMLGADTHMHTILSIFLKFRIFLWQYTLLCVSQIGLNFSTKTCCCPKPGMLNAFTATVTILWHMSSNPRRWYFTHSIEDHMLLAEIMSKHFIVDTSDPYNSEHVTVESRVSLLVLRKPSLEPHILKLQQLQNKRHRKWVLVSGQEWLVTSDK